MLGKYLQIGLAEIRAELISKLFGIITIVQQQSKQGFLAGILRHFVHPIPPVIVHRFQHQFSIIPNQLGVVHRPALEGLLLQRLVTKSMDGIHGRLVK